MLMITLARGCSCSKSNIASRKLFSELKLDTLLMRLLPFVLELCSSWYQHRVEYDSGQACKILEIDYAHIGFRKR